MGYCLIPLSVRLSVRVRTLLLAALCQLWSMAALAAPVILIVEGVNPYRMFLPLSAAAKWEDGYLERSPLTAAVVGVSGGEVRRIAWSGIPTDLSSLRAAVAQLKAELAAAHAQGRTVWLLTHSLGSVIAYSALADAGGRTSVQTFVSLASPLGRPFILQWLALAQPGLPVVAMGGNVEGPKRLGVGRWINVYTEWDPLGGPIRAEGVENHALQLLPSGPFPTLRDLILAHTLPFRDAGVAGLITASYTGPNIPAEPPGR